MLMDLAVITLTVTIVGLLMLAAYQTGYREGHGDGFLRGKYVGKAIMEAERQ